MPRNKLQNVFACLLLAGLSSCISSCDLGQEGGEPPKAVPEAPLNVVASAGNTRATVAWDAPDSNAIFPVGYTVTAVEDTGKYCSTDGKIFCVVSGLVNGVAYTFRVRAFNASGTGPSSSPSAPVTPGPTVPEAPPLIAAVPGNGEVEVSWAAPSDGGTPIVRYLVSTLDNPSSQCVAESLLTCRVPGLANGLNYQFLVRAVNEVGMGPSSPVSVFVKPVGPPGAPERVSAASTFWGANVSWSVPVSNGGLPINQYLAFSEQDTTKYCQASAAYGSSTSCKISDLIPGSIHTFRVKAFNDAGAGLASRLSAPVTIPTYPGAPTAVSAVSGPSYEYGSVTVSWSAPASSGGLAISAYAALAVDNSSRICTSTAGGRSCTVTGLAKGEVHAYSVVAFNAMGQGPSSLPSESVGPLAIDTVGPAWVRVSSGTEATLNSITWADTQLVAVGANGIALTSRDGLNWTSHSMGVNMAFNGIAWTGRILVAVGPSGIIMTSPDGVNWAQAASGTSSPLWGITRAGDRLFAYGSAGMLTLTPDSVGVKTQWVSVTGILYGGAWNGVTAVAVGSVSRILTSSDLAKWGQSYGTSSILSGVAWTGSQFLAAGSFSVLSSSNGSTWSTVSFGASAEFNAVVHAGDHTYLMGNGGALFQWDNGVVGGLISGTTADLRAMAWTGTRAVVVGTSGTILISP